MLSERSRQALAAVVEADERSYDDWSVSGGIQI